MGPRTLFLITILTLARAVSADPIVLRIPPSSPDQTGGTFGHPGAGASVFGQTFMLPADATTLESFTFFIWHVEGSILEFRGFVMPWTGTRAEGRPIFESDVMSIAQVSEDRAVYQRVELNTDSLPLVPNTSYVAFLFALGVSDQPAHTAWLLNVSNPYPNGGWVVSDAGSDFGSLTRADWTFLDALNVYDLSVEMRFGRSDTPATIPEPGTCVLLATGIAAIAFRRYGGSIRR